MTTFGNNEAHPELCDRCTQVVLDFKTPPS